MPMETPADLNEFVWIWNDAAGLSTPPVHRRILRWLEARRAGGDTRLLLMAFRGCGKSTLVGLYCAWLLSRWPETRILVLAADHLLATKMVGTVRRIVERHPLCRAILPEVPEAWAVDRFTVRRAGALRDPSMLAAGLAGNITGARADVIICDDVEVAGNCDTAGKRTELRERLAETEFILTPGGTLLYVGTPHCAESLYRTPEEGEPTLAGYRRLVVPLLNAAGRSAWPQRFPAEDVARLRERVGPIQFSRQMLLRPVAGAAARLNPGLLIRYRDELDYREAHGRPVLGLMGRRMVSGGGYWDPAYGRPGRGDGSVLAIAYADGEGNHYLHRLHYLTHDPDLADDPATQQCRQVAALAREFWLPVLRVETNGIGRFLPALLRREMARAGAPCAVVEQHSRTPKQQRILTALDPLLAARRLHAQEQVFRTPFPVEMAEWKPDTAGTRDDALDALAGCLAAEPVRLPGAPPPTRPPGWRGAP